MREVGGAGTQVFLEKYSLILGKKHTLCPCVTSGSVAAIF